jgi:hypothetical protein
VSQPHYFFGHRPQQRVAFKLGGPTEVRELYHRLVTQISVHPVAQHQGELLVAAC